MRQQRRLYVAAGAAVLALAAGSTVAVAGVGGASNGGSANSSCSAPELPGAIVHVTVTDMGGAGMSGRGMGGGGMGGTMRLLLDRSQVVGGAVSLIVANTGSIVHELVALPLAAGQQVGERPVGADFRIPEAGSLGEVSATCGAGAGDGIDPGALGWATLTLAPGHYELVCNLAGHYAAGMYAELTVS